MAAVRARVVQRAGSGRERTTCRGPVDDAGADVDRADVGGRDVAGWLQRELEVAVRHAALQEQLVALRACPGGLIQLVVEVIAADELRRGRRARRERAEAVTRDVDAARELVL